MPKPNQRKEGAAKYESEEDTEIDIPDSTLSFILANIDLAESINNFASNVSKLDCTSFIFEQIHKLNAVNDTPQNETQPSPRQSSHHEVRSRPSLPEYHLPRIDIPKFNGDYEQWPPFYDIFRTTIHDNNDISTVHKLHLLKNSLLGEASQLISHFQLTALTVHKLHFLKNSLLGEASQLISHFQLTALNYMPAWNMLTSRYENKRILVNNQLTILFNQKTIHQDTALSVKHLLDTTKKCMYAISNLGIDTTHWDLILTYLLVQKMTKETHQLWEQSLNNTREVPTYEQITEFLEGRYRTLEIVANEKSIHNRQINRHAKVFHNQPANNRNATNSCCLCSGTHSIRQCDRFKSMEITERISFIKGKSMCLNCLASSHTISKCTSKNRCFHCKKSHHSMLHLQFNNQTAPPSAIVNQSTTYISEAQPCSSAQSPNAFHVNNNINTDKILLATAIIKINSSNGEEFFFRALLDQGSQASFITENAASQLKLLRSPINVTVSGIGNNKVLTAKNKTSFVINAHFQTKANLQVNALILKTLTNIIPSVILPSGHWNHISNLTLAEPQFYKPNKIDILLGADVYANLLLDGIQRGPFGSPTAQKTKLGWILSGLTSEPSIQSYPPHANKKITSLVTHCTAEQELKRFWELESIPEKRSLTEDEKHCEDFFEKTVQRDKDGRFIVRLIFNRQFGKDLLLGSSRPIACIRQQQLEKRFLKNPELKPIYSDVIKDYLQQNHMEIISSTDNEPSDISSNHEAYLPHHVVTKETSSTTKHRVVFNASQSTTSGKSLNDCCLVGPQLQESLLALSLRFRKYKYAMTADIEKMYRQIRMAYPDTQYQKIVWRENPSDPISDYRLMTVTFGTACAPYLAIKTIQHLAKADRNKYPLASDVILNDFYVDDVLTGADTVPEAIELQNQLIKMLKGGCFNLKKWTSNSSTILENVPISHRETQFPFKLKEDDTIKTLGLYWHPAADHFQFKICLEPITENLTKRKLLSDIAKVFDPNGWLAPTTIKAKIIMQQLWLSGLNWDDNLPPSVTIPWSNYRRELHLIEQIKIPRWLNTDHTNQKLQLHCFSDASEQAYAAAIYLRVVDSVKSVSTYLIASKTKVAPIKTISIPRLELCGAVLAAKLMKKVQDIMKFPDIELYAWTDSTIVLAWLRGHPNKWKTFIANRVVEIHNSTEVWIWNYVKSNDNPADVASRGINPSEIKDHQLCWHGPQWLKDDEKTWPTAKQISDTNLEQRKLATVTTTTVCISNDILYKYSNLYKLLRVTAYCFRFISSLKSSSVNINKWLSTAEIEKSHNYWINHVQEMDFPEEIKSLKLTQSVSTRSKLVSLNPFLDANGIMRVGGRLKNSLLEFEAKHPIILSDKNQLTAVVLNDWHIRSQHGGPQLMLNLIRKKYWIINARNAIRFFIHKCISCHRQKAETRTQLMGQLPQVRITPARPFSRVGVDYAGPFEIKMHKFRGARTYKGYISLFICMAVKAIHLEIVSELTTKGFLAAFHRFTGRRGLSSDVYSDCGTNFVGAARSLTEEFDRVRIETDMTQILSKDGTDWHFVPPSSPHFGGLWEAGVKSTKYHLKRVLGNANLTYEDLSTVSTQIEAALNSRPIHPLYDDPSDLEALTPGHFLIGDAIIAPPSRNVININENRLDKWQSMLQINQNFWKRWQLDCFKTPKKTKMGDSTEKPEKQ